MTRTQRRRTVDQLNAIWTKRDIPGIELGKLVAMDDATLVHLHRFWAHKDRWWDVEGAPGFVEAAPNEPLVVPASPIVSKTPIARESVGGPIGRSYAFGRERGRTVFRQIKKHG